MKISARILSLVISLVMAVTLFAGCSNSANSDVSEPDVTLAPEVTDAPEITTTEATTTTEETTTEATTTVATTTTPETTTEVTTTTEATTTEVTTVTTTEATIAVEDISGEVYMYAKSSVNVRTKPDADSERVGHLDEGEKVQVTGKAANGWYRIKFKNGEYFVSGSYLTDTAPKANEPKEEKDDKTEQATNKYKVPITAKNWATNSSIAEVNVKYNSDGSAYIANTSIVGWAIPEVKMGENVRVTVKGSSVGEFRMWLVASGQATASNIMTSSELGFFGGDFEFTFILTAEDHDGKGITAANGFCFKGPTWNTNLDQLTVKSVELTYLGNGPIEPEEEDDEPKDTSEKTQWVASWGSAQLTAGADQMPKNVLFAGNTVRMQIRPSLGGSKLKLTFSNEYGNSALTINAATLAKLIDPGKSDINTSSLVNITFGGKKSVTIAAGKTVTSDEIDFKFSALDDLAVTLYLGNVPSTITSHTASRCSTWLAKGNQTSAKTVSGETMTAWYFLSRLDVWASSDASAIVCMGDSLTDGASVTTNSFARWTDELARRLQADDDTDNYSVINMGIGATALMGAWGNSGQARFTRDVLNVPGAEYLIIFYGVNDIGYAQNDISGQIINTYKDMIKKAHAKGIKVYGCTITPFKGSGYYSELHEQIRVKVNNFIMSKDSGFDGYIDLSSAVADPSDSITIRRSYISVWNDYLHFNDTGYKFVGKTIYDAISKDLK